MKLSDPCVSRGTVKSIGGDELTHRRLVDLGLLGARFTVKARKGGSALLLFECGKSSFSAVVSAAAACTMTVAEG